MSRFQVKGAKDGQRFRIAYGQDHAIGWFIDIEPINEWSVGKTITFDLEVGDSDEDHSWADMRGVILAPATDWSGKWLIAPTEVIKVHQIGERLWEPVFPLAPVWLYQEDVEMGLRKEKSTLFDGITMLDVRDTLVEYGCNLHHSAMELF